MPLGLYRKYEIRKADGTPVDPDAKYFVLRYDKDRHARIAMASYAKSVLVENADLAREIIEDVRLFAAESELRNLPRVEVSPAIQGARGSSPLSGYVKPEILPLGGVCVECGGPASGMCPTCRKHVCYKRNGTCTVTHREKCER